MSEPCDHMNHVIRSSVCSGCHQYVQPAKPMSETPNRAWTPAPWIIEHATNPTGTGMVKTDNGIQFANVYTCEQEHGDCHLIALAPEMAEAIIHYAECSGWEWPNDPEATDALPCPRCDSELNAIAAKLRKIEGDNDD